MKKRFFPLLALVLTAAAVLFCVLWQQARRDQRELLLLARSGAAEAETRFSDYRLRGEESDYWGGVAAWRVFQQAHDLLRSEDRLVLNEIYAALLLSPEQARPQLEALTEILAQFVGDPLDQNALLRLYDLRASLQN